MAGFDPAIRSFSESRIDDSNYRPLPPISHLQIRTRMSIMRSLFLLLAVALALLAHPAYSDDTPLKGDLAKLQGVWKGKTGRDGFFDSVMTIKGDAGTFDNTTKDGRKIGLKYKLTVNDKAKPHKTMDHSEIVRYGGSGKGPEHVYCIYEFIDENTVRFSNGFDKYPTEFKDDDDRQPFQFTLKRVTEKKDKDKDK
jgi:hypothetical protein